MFWKMTFLTAMTLLNGHEEHMLKSVMQGRLDGLRAGSVCSPLDGAIFQENEDNAFYAWGINYVCGNGVIEKDVNRIPTDEEIDAAIEFFSSKNLPFSWWSSAKVLEEKGFQFAGNLSGIALDISQELPPKPEHIEHLTIKIIDGEAEVLAFSELAGQASAMHPDAIEEWFSVNMGVMNQQEMIHFMAYLDEKPVGTVTLSISPTAAGIWSLATLPEYRKAGIGSALVHAALVEAKRRDYSHVMAMVMPKGMSSGLFNKLGFKDFCPFPCYLYGLSPDRLEK